MTTFARETDLCTAFIECLPEGWNAYPETGGFDILLVREADGFQIGVEAKLRLNPRVIAQVVEGSDHWRVCSPQPDCRAVLVPDGAVNADLRTICARLGITVIEVHPNKGRGKGYITAPFRPQLPEIDDKRFIRESWFERCPDSRVPLPEWVPDVVAGASAPVMLTQWKVKALKIVVLLERRGYVTRRDFKLLEISIQRWIDGRWLEADGKGGWVRGPRMPDFQRQHPVVYEQIAAEFEAWAPQEMEKDK